MAKRGKKAVERHRICLYCLHFLEIIYNTRGEAMIVLCPKCGEKFRRAEHGQVREV